MDEQKKPWYLSKTLWTNLVMGIAVIIFPSLKEMVSEEILASIFAFVNIALRFISKDKLTLT